MTWSPASQADGLRWMLKDHLDHVWLASFNFIPRCNVVKVLEVMAIRDSFDYILSTNVQKIFAVLLFKDESSNLLEVSFFIEEVKSLASELGTISFSHMKHYHSFLALASRTLEERTSSFLGSQYPK